MSEQPLRLPAVGERVRAVIEGEGPSARVDPGTADRLPASYRVVVTGEVTGWERGGRDDTYVTLAGWGRVPASAVRRRRWWRR